MGPAALAVGLALATGITIGLAFEAEVRRLGEERYAASLDSALVQYARGGPQRELAPAGEAANAESGFLFLLDRRGKVLVQPVSDSGTAWIQPSTALRMIATGSGTVVQANANSHPLWCVYRALESAGPGEPGGGIAGWAVPLETKRAAVLRVRRWWISATALAASLALLLVLGVRKRPGAVHRAGERGPGVAGPGVNGPGVHGPGVNGPGARSTLDAMREAVVATDRDTRVTFLNPAAAALSPLDVPDALAQPLDMALPLVDSGGHGLTRLVESVSATQHSPHEAWIYTVPGTDGRSFEATAKLTEDGAVLVLRDVTQRTETDARSRERGRMEAIGRVAAGLAHDVNNLLGSVRGNAELLLLDLPESEDSAELRESAAAILDATRRGSELTSKLLAYSRKPEASQRIDCHVLIEGVLEIAGRRFGPDITLRRQLAAEEVTVLGDEPALESALLHLAKNARDALAGGGALTIATSDSTLPADDTHGRGTSGVRPAIRITVRDDGPGMEEATRRKVFDPFFTTKDPGEGTGLGLAAVYGAVVGHGGDIEVESTPGAGTAVHVRLPLAPRVDRPR